MAETFVLVHGAWHGAWCWAAVANQLERAGDRALAVDLPGLAGAQSAIRWSRPRAMTSAWISLVPSPIIISGASR